ncbi:MAG: hybrid sensor histidine kinase/response regulator [Bacillota bacterium]
MARILVVDDSIIMRKNLKTLLTQAGHTVVGEASNGLQGHLEYGKLKPDLVTMDITMPVMDGIQAVDKIIRDFPEAKIIMISALDQKHMVFKALKSGAKHYIIKPITFDKVMRVIDEVLDYDRLEDYSKEMGSADKALDHMWIEIKESKDEIVDLNKSTEEIVEERTAKLEDTNRKLKETLEELQMTQQKLVQSEKSAALAGMVAGMAHEINTPIGLCLTAISFLEEKNKEIMEIYQQGSMKRSDFEKYLGLIEETTKSSLINLIKASELIRSFKMVAADQTGDVKRRFSMKKYVEDVLLSLKPELKKRKHQVHIQCEEPLEIYSFPGAFSQILTNLVMNTLIHGYDEGDEVHITLSITKDGENMLFEYSDEGRGIKKEIQDRIFDPFFTTNRGKGGTGLGLNIVYNIVTQTLGGTIRCESEEGMGAAFIIRIPVEQ